MICILDGFHKTGNRGILDTRQLMSETCLKQQANNLEGFIRHLHLKDKVSAQILNFTRHKMSNDAGKKNTHDKQEGDLLIHQKN